MACSRVPIWTESASLAENRALLPPNFDTRYRHIARDSKSWKSPSLRVGMRPKGWTSLVYFVSYCFSIWAASQKLSWVNVAHLVFSFHQSNRDEIILDVQLMQHENHSLRTGGGDSPVKFECHCYNLCNSSRVWHAEWCDKKSRFVKTEWMRDIYRAFKYNKLSESVIKHDQPVLHPNYHDKHKYMSWVAVFGMGRTDSAGFLGQSPQANGPTKTLMATETLIAV